MSKELGELVVKQCRPEDFKDEVDIVFSGLDSDVAGDTGMIAPLVVRSIAQWLTSSQKWPS